MEPIIVVLCYSRSGSTLLRYILDAHPSVFCPPELHLAAILSQVARYMSKNLFFRLSSDEGTVEEQSAEAVAALAAGIVASSLSRAGKARFCDKSVSSLENVETVLKVFPDAQFVCLHRNAFDHQRSALEAIEKVPDGDSFGFADFVQGANGEAAAGVVDYWLHNESALLDFQHAHADRAISVRYEDLVLSPYSTLAALFDFLQLSWKEDLLDAAFNLSHLPGPGDWKIKRTKSLHSSSVGRWRESQALQIDGERLRAVRQLHEALGYDKEEYVDA